MADAYIVVRGVKDGVPYERTCPLHIPLVWATGELERVSDCALADMVTDITHEQHRRAGTLKQLGGWNPEQTQYRSR